MKRLSVLRAQLWQDIVVVYSLEKLRSLTKVHQSFAHGLPHLTPPALACGRAQQQHNLPTSQIFDIGSIIRTCCSSFWSVFVVHKEYVVSDLAHSSSLSLRRLEENHLVPGIGRLRNLHQTVLSLSFKARQSYFFLPLYMNRYVWAMSEFAPILAMTSRLYLPCRPK